jgi:hypothetical protein
VNLDGVVIRTDQKTHPKLIRSVRGIGEHQPSARGQFR